MAAYSSDLSVFLGVSSITAQAADSSLLTAYAALDSAIQQLTKEAKLAA